MREGTWSSSTTFRSSRRTLTGVQRRVVIGLRMPPQRWVAMAHWMMDHADRYEGRPGDEP
ncbi:hypothetical protein [Methanoculleus sp. 10]|uniref:hypothetical protein n=1 Tax=Methanoculleus sp. 10 TaxID=430615 RepID=UPI0025E4F026|nr:hypothetical protein [Methanoculleus sp. 10]